MLVELVHVKKSSMLMPTERRIVTRWSLLIDSVILLFRLTGV